MRLMRRCPGEQTLSDQTMKLTMLLIPLLFLETSVDALATPSPPPCEDTDPVWCQREVGTFWQKIDRCKQWDAGAVDMRCRLSCGVCSLSPPPSPQSPPPPSSSLPSPSPPPQPWSPPAKGKKEKKDKKGKKGEAEEGGEEEGSEGGGKKGKKGKKGKGGDGGDEEGEAEGADKKKKKKKKDKD